MPGVGMDPMTAAQGVYGGYGMNMNDIGNGMGMGMNFDAGQGMYGGWDSTQNNMWNGGQDKYNPTAFANGMRPEYGASGFGGYNVSQRHGNYPQMQMQMQQQQQQFHNPDFQNGFYGPGYGRGIMTRGRGRGYFQGGRGRGTFAGSLQSTFTGNTNHTAVRNQQPLNSQNHSGPHVQLPTLPTMSSAADIKKFSEELCPGGEGEVPEAPTENSDSIEVKNGSSNPSPSDSKPTGATPAETSPDEATPADSQQLQGIPTIDSIDQAANSVTIPTAPAAMSAPIEPGPGPGPGSGSGRGRPPVRGGFHSGRGGSLPNGNFQGPTPFVPPSEPRGQGVEGAPAAPRAMREGLPNTSMRGRVFHSQGRMSIPIRKSSDASRRYVQWIVVIYLIST
jgi:hypothetical protein